MAQSRISPLAGQKQKNESSRAIAACNDYLRLGPSRSLSILTRLYNEKPQNAPTKSRDTLANWSIRFAWQERVEIYDAGIEKAKDERVKEIMSNGLALIHERVQTLKELEKMLLDQLYEEGTEGVLHNLWLPDVKQIGSGDTAERVDIERYNSPLVSDIRGVLDDLAKETGGRVQKQDITSKGEKIVVVLKSADE